MKRILFITGCLVTCIPELFSQNVGIGAIIPVSKLHVTGGLLADGATGATPVINGGVRMMWVPDKRAFRAGEVTSAQWNTDSLGIWSVAMGYNTKGLGSFSTAFGAFSIAAGSTAFAANNQTRASGASSACFGQETWAKASAGFVIGSFNDNTESSDPLLLQPANRLFQVGNGTADNARGNALTILQNGNAGLGILNPDVNLVVNEDIRIDAANANNGDRNSSLRFGNSITGEFIASKRTAGGNQNGLDFYTASSSRLFISNSGNVTVAQNLLVAGFINTVGTLSVAGGKGIIRNIDATQSKKLSSSVTVNTSFTAGETKTFAVTWPETFTGSNVEAYVGNVTSGSGGWAEVVMTLFNVSSTGAQLYVYNPRTTSASPNFTVKVIAIGPQ